MRLRIAPPLLALLLAGCGRDPPAGPESGATRIHEASVQCDALPDFAVLYVDAVVTACFNGRSTLGGKRENGTVIYTTRTAPEEVLTWYKEQASAKALIDEQLTKTLYSAGDGMKRNLTVFTEPKDGGAKVTLNWSRDL